MDGVAEREDLTIHIVVGCLSGHPDEPYYLRVNATPRFPVHRSFHLNIPPDLHRKNDQLMLTLQNAVLNPDNAARSTSSDAYHALSQFGHELFQLLTSVDGKVRDALSNPLHIYREDHPNDVRITFLLEFDERARDIATLFWEALNWEGTEYPSFLIQQPFTNLVRYVAGRSRRRRVADGSPLRMLVVTSGYGTDGQLDAHLMHSIPRERQLLLETLRQPMDLGALSLDFLPEHADEPAPTMKQVRDALAVGNYDILHYLGHAAHEETGKQQEYLMLRSIHKGESPGTKILYESLRTLLEGSGLQLVVLNACALEAQARVAMRLAANGVGAVVAMRSSIAQDVITQEHGFTQSFYTALAAGKRVDVAFAEARHSIWDDQNCVECFIPTLVISGHPHYAGAPLMDAAQPQAQRVREELAKQAAQAAQVRANAERQAEDVAWAEAVRQEVRAQHYPGVLKLLSERPEGHSLPESATGILRGTFQLLSTELNEFRRRRDWSTAREASDVLELISRRVSDLEPEIRRSALELEVARDLQSRRQRILQSRTNKQWVELQKEAAEYLALDPQHADVRQWAEEAASYLRINVRVHGKIASRLEELIKSRQYDEALSQGEPYASQVSNAERPKVERLLLRARMLRDHGKQRWPQMAETARSLLEANPQDQEARGLLMEALQSLITQALASKEPAAAEPLLMEALRFARDSREQQRFRGQLGRLWLDRAQESWKQFQWQEVLNACRAILADPELSSLHPEAGSLERDAGVKLKLLKQVRLHEKQS